MPDILVSRHLVIPEAELVYTFTPSSGPGGQHANKASTRVVVTWNIERSAALTVRQKRRLQRVLSGRIDSSGTLRLTSDRYRSQHRNREDARGRLAKLVRSALEPRKSRVATRPTRASKQRRLDDKKKRSEVKRLRRSLDD
jgi:ribosome-associated protein